MIDKDPLDAGVSPLPEPYISPDIGGGPLSGEDVAQPGDDELARRALAILALARNFHPKERKLEIFGDSDDEFTLTLGLLKDRLSLSSDVRVLYPGSSTHAGVAHVFGKDKTVHVDPDQSACNALEAKGYTAVATTIEDYLPDEPFDVMVLLNTYGQITDSNKDHLRQLVRSGGVIIANNYTHWARDLAELQDVVELQGAVLPDYRNAEANYLPAAEVPREATDTPTEYYKIGREGGVTRGTPEDYNFTEEEPLYPDGLFVFRVK